jgi:hypothetical protein
MACDARMLHQEGLNSRQQHRDRTQERPLIPKKIRESCNNCAISKVKCSKDRPTRKRCEDRGIFCQFSLSKRSGKRRRVPVFDDSNTTSSGSASPRLSELCQDQGREVKSSSDAQHSQPDTSQTGSCFGTIQCSELVMIAGSLKMQSDMDPAMAKEIRRYVPSRLSTLPILRGTQQFQFAETPQRLLNSHPQQMLQHQLLQYLTLWSLVPTSSRFLVPKTA